jgi:hypothetical protein
MRFAEQSNDFYNPSRKADHSKPLKDSEMLRQAGLSNGSVLVKGKRTANFETGEFMEMYTDLRK